MTSVLSSGMIAAPATASTATRPTSSAGGFDTAMTEALLGNAAATASASASATTTATTDAGGPTVDDTTVDDRTVDDTTVDDTTAVSAEQTDPGSLETAVPSEPTASADQEPNPGLVAPAPAAQFIAPVPVAASELAASQAVTIQSAAPESIINPNIRPTAKSADASASTATPAPVPPNAPASSVPQVSPGASQPAVPAVTRQPASATTAPASALAATITADPAANPAVATTPVADVAEAVPVGPAPQVPVASAVGTTQVAPPPAAPSASSAPAIPVAFTTQVSGPVFTLAAAGQGEHVMTVNVTPDNLGPVTVRAHVSGDGIRLELFAPTDGGRDALRGILNDLRRDLAAAGANASVDLSTRNQPSHDDGQRHQPAAQHPRFSFDSGAREESTDRSYRPLAWGATSTIDVLA